MSSLAGVARERDVLDRLRAMRGPRPEVQRLWLAKGEWTTGHAEMVTDDKSGKKLPPHSFGEWVFSRTINVAGETHLMGGVSIARRWLTKMDFTIGRNSSLTYRPNRRPLGRQLCLPISPTSLKIHTPSGSRRLTLQSRSRFLRQAVKVDPTMRRTDHHEDAQAFYG